MLGVHIRGYQHLKRSVGISQPIKLMVMTSNGRVFIVECVKTSNSDDIHVLNNTGWGRGGFNLVTPTTPQDIRDMLTDYQARYHYCYSIRGEEDLRCLGLSDMIRLHEDFYKVYENVRVSNKKLFSNIFGKVTSEMDALVQYFFLYSHDSPNLFAWALTNYYKYGVSKYLLKHILVWQEMYPQLVRRLTKGTLTAYNGKDRVHALYNEMIALRREKRANDVFNTFNTAQKKLLKAIELTDDVLNTCSKFNQLSQGKKHNFIRKMSTVDSVDEILRQMKILSKTHFEWTKSSLMEYIANSQDTDLDCEIVFEQDNLLVVKVNNYETIKYLAKTTNWCISKNKRYWDDYTQNRNEGAIQYIVFDFDKKEDDELSIVGFTTATNLGITDAHSFTNVSMMGNSDMVYSNLNTFLPEVFNITTFLRDHKIPLKSFYDVDTSPFNWNKEECIAFIEYAVGEDNFDILSDIDNKLCVQATSENVRFIVGNHIPSNHKTIMFFDFNKDSDDENRLLYGIVSRCSISQEDECNEILNTKGVRVPTSINALLKMYGLPFDTLARVYSVSNDFRTALSSNDMDTLKHILQNHDYKAEILGKQSNITLNLYEAISRSIWNYSSFDYINLIYDDCKLKLSDILPVDKIDRLIGGLMYDIIAYVHGITHFHVPTENEINQLLNGEIKDIEKAKYIGRYIILSRILATETWTSIIGNQTRSAIHELGRNPQLAMDLTSKLYHLMQFNNIQDVTAHYIKLVVKHCNADVLHKLSKRNLNMDAINYILLNMRSSEHAFYSVFNEKLAQVAKVSVV